MKKQQKLLVVAAHPDDEVLGCAATIRLRVNQGWQAKLITMTAGVGGRIANTGDNERRIQEAQNELRIQCEQASQVLGFQQLTHLDFPDNRMDVISRSELYHAIDPIIKEYQPDLVLTHHPGDYNWDHTRTFDAVMMATRANYPDHYPCEVWTFEVLSSTERAWQDANRAFHPNIYIDVATTIEEKKIALRHYQSEYRDYPHPRSVEAVDYLARKRGAEVGLHYAEAFHLIRRIERGNDHS